MKYFAHLLVLVIGFGTAQPSLAFEPSETEKSRTAESLLKFDMALEQVLGIFGPPDFVVSGSDGGEWSPFAGLVSLVWKNEHCPPVIVDFSLTTDRLTGHDEGRGGCKKKKATYSKLPPRRFSCPVKGQRRYLRKYCGQ